MPYTEQLTSITVPVSTKRDILIYKEMNGCTSWKQFFEQVMAYIDEQEELREKDLNSSSTTV